MIEGLRLAGTRRRDAAALFAGGITPLAFAPFNLFPLAVLGPMLLFLTWRTASVGRAAWRGFLYGLGCFGVGVSWVYVSLHDFGFMPLPLAALATLLFCAGLALYPALLGAVQARLFARAGATVHLVLAVPALWVVFEWFRGWFLSGFPWLNLGYSQSASALAGYAPIAGVYGASLIVALSAGLAAAMVVDRPWRWRVYLPAFALLWLGGFALGRVVWVEPAGAPLRVAMVQGNVALAQKWKPEQRQAIVDQYVRMSERANDVDLIVWPEAALPGQISDFGPTLMPRLTQLARKQDADLVFGLVEYDADGRYYNSVMRIGAEPAMVYRKRHLVPFGEYLPWPTFFDALIRHLQIPMSNFSTGANEQSALRAANQSLAVTVCYEDAFGEEALPWLPQASLLLNVSEDAWFGNSLAPHQRLQMAQLRALEVGRPMVRAANTGPSAAIDHNGVVQIRSPQFRPYLLIAGVQPMQGVTPYVRFGNIAALLAALVSLAAAIVAARATRTLR